MTKPIGYYTAFTSGDGGLLSELEEVWGSYFEQIRNDEKLWLIARVANDLWLKYPINEPPGEDVERVATRVNEISVDNRIALIHALIANTKWIN